MPVLSAAASGAKAVSSWLSSEGFETKLYTDESGPVIAATIFDAISEFVGRGTLDQMIVYFSGHGFLNSFNEYWMLSQAPHNPNEAVSLTESFVLARESAIPNVVFVSDACRSTPDSINASRVRGSLIFPNTAISRNVRADVDMFLAALPGQAAAEIPVSQSAPGFEGLFTACLLSAFQEPVESLVRTVGGIRVLPNRNLKIYLEAEVMRRAEAKALRLHQKPDAQVLSSDSTYIAPIRPTTAQTTKTVSLEPTIRDVALRQLASLGTDLAPLSARRLYLNRIPSSLDQETVSFERVQSSIAAETTTSPTIAGVRSHEAGFSISGSQVSEAITADNATTQVDALRRLIVVRFRDAPAASVAIRFADGSGSILAALRGYTCSLVIEAGKILSASYLANDQPPNPFIDKLRSTVAAAAQFGVFRIDGDRDTANRKAAEFGDKIRAGKSADPTLGLYAAYAYHQADLVDRVRSVDDFMRGDLQVRLFDVAMLSRRLSSDRRRSEVFPFCPMLAQGWGLLRVTQAGIRPEVDRLRDHLRPALWSTLEPEGVSIAADLLKIGRVE
ncbi:caspase family protein [Bradyrhizobium yuanmingense]|uniref:caspase family protein n=1 Tax=Bradyrhizobium yuanmingense TaxID=108015 RepID=UPI0021A33725|nr:caspase family protein [Bradyrhizobium sp. CB1024]UWU83191.1 caspase family protein [Bradyrhizobium sp. CB1024]